MIPNKPPPTHTENKIPILGKPSLSPKIKGPKILPSNCCNTKMNKAKYKAVIG